MPLSPDMPVADALACEPALTLLLTLENDGYYLQIRPDGRLVIRPASRLAPQQRAMITAHREALGVLVRHCLEGA